LAGFFLLIEDQSQGMGWMERFLLWLVPALGSQLLRLLAWSMRFEWCGREVLDGLAAQDRRIIYAFWHNRLLLMPFARPRLRRLAVLVSLHRDGEYISRTVAYFGIHSVRGSSRRGAYQGFKECLQALREGFDLAITPDGPRGPRYVVQPGVVELARRTGAVILPVSFGAERVYTFASWDRFMLPLPGSRGVFVVGRPLYVPSGMPREAVEGWRQKLQAELQRITVLADRYFAGP